VEMDQGTEGPKREKLTLAEGKIIDEGSIRERWAAHKKDSTPHQGGPGRSSRRGEKPQRAECRRPVKRLPEGKGLKQATGLEKD